jgi:GrpB-like predicted nucleotidyltransferase (UPF0157 family)
VSCQLSIPTLSLRLQRWSTHAEAARQFANLKRVLATRFSQDREAYMNAKSSHVQEILRLASDAA